MSPDRTKSVSRARVAAVALILLAAVAGLVAGMGSLRHPHPAAGPVDEQLDPLTRDPRVAIQCPDPPPREDEPAQQRVAQPQAGVPTVTSNELYDCPSFYDELVIRYEGEVVGAVLRREQGAWIQVNDDIYAGDVGPLPVHRDFRGGNAGVGVFVQHELANQIRWVGGPRAKGDVIEVIGRFHRVDPNSEVAVIHAVDGRVLEEGSSLTEEPLLDRQIAALAAAAVAMALLLVQIRRSRRLP